MSTDYGIGTGRESVIKNTKNEPVVGRIAIMGHAPAKEKS